jgi:hypothetical protein
MPSNKSSQERRRSQDKKNRRADKQRLKELRRSQGAGFAQRRR